MQAEMQFDDRELMRAMEEVTRSSEQILRL